MKFRLQTLPLSTKASISAQFYSLLGTSKFPEEELVFKFWAYATVFFFFLDPPVQVTGPLTAPESELRFLISAKLPHSSEALSLVYQ